VALYQVRRVFCFLRDRAGGGTEGRRGVMKRPRSRFEALRDTVDLPSDRGKLGKGPKTLGKCFAECYTRYTTHGIDLLANSSLSSVFYRTLGKNKLSVKKN
jgi:hypothetical protein